jgi:hypothetical protein
MFEICIFIWVFYKLVICMENAISSQIASFKNEAGDSCPSESQQLTQLSKTG